MVCFSLRENFPLAEGGSPARGIFYFKTLATQNGIGDSPDSQRLIVLSSRPTISAKAVRVKRLAEMIFNRSDGFILACLQ